MALEGTLKDITLPNLVQLQCSEQKRAELVLTRANNQGVLVFAEGELVHASVGSLSGEDAVYELLTWDQAGFQVNDGLANLPERNVTVPWQSLMLEGLRRADEIRSERVQVNAQVVKDFAGLAGIAEWHLVTMDGQEINAAGGAIASPIGEWTAKAFREGMRLARTLANGEPNEMVLTNSRQKRIIIPRDRYYLMVVPTANAVINLVRDALSRLNQPEPKQR